MRLDHHREWKLGYHWEWPFSFRFRCDRWDGDKFKRSIVVDVGLGLKRNHPGWSLHVAFILGAVSLRWDCRIWNLDAIGRSLSISLIPRIFVKEGGPIYFFNKEWCWELISMALIRYLRDRSTEGKS